MKNIKKMLKNFERKLDLNKEWDIYEFPHYYLYSDGIIKWRLKYVEKTCSVVVLVETLIYVFIFRRKKINPFSELVISFLCPKATVSGNVGFIYFFNA